MKSSFENRRSKLRSVDVFRKQREFQERSIIINYCPQHLYKTSLVKISNKKNTNFHKEIVSTLNESCAVHSIHLLLLVFSIRLSEKSLVLKHLKGKSLMMSCQVT